MPASWNRESELGGDPAEAKQLANLAACDTLDALANRYLESRKAKWRPASYAASVRHLLKYAKPLHRLPITAVSQRDVAKLLNSITAASGEPTANRARSTLSAFFSWVLKEGIRLPEGNPVTHTHKHQEQSRDRVLTDAELKTVWHACPDSEFGAIIRLLILTGQRANEIGGLRWDEVRDNETVLPKSRTKNKREHTIPLSGAAKSILDKFRSNHQTHVVWCRR